MCTRLFKIIFLSIFLVFAFCYQTQAQESNSQDEQTDTSEQTQVETEPSKKESYTRRGIIIAKNRIRLNSRIDTTVAKLHTSEGAQFKKNDLLIEFDCSIERTALEEARLSHEVAKLDFNTKKREAEEMPVSPELLELLKLKSELALTKLNNLRERIKHCRLFAPFSGRVLKILIQEYETTEALTPVIEIVDNQALHFRVFLPWAWLKWLSVGDTAEIDVMNRKYPAKLVELSEEVDPLDQSIKALLEFQSQDGLRIGMNGVGKFKGF